MAEFLTTNGTASHIEKIIMDATSELVLVSPYLQISSTFYERLKDASNNRVNVKIIYGKDELQPNQLNLIAELKNVNLFFSKNLHAKCYFNESTMVITSMNMYAFSEKNNREMGVLIDCNRDKDLFEKARKEAFSILQSAEQISLRKLTSPITYGPRTSLPESRVNLQKPQHGFCIRCSAHIEYDASRPYCPECYYTWAEFENYDYIENVCHSCGQTEQTSMNKPKCYNCHIQQKEQMTRTY